MLNLSEDRRKKLSTPSRKKIYLSDGINTVNKGVLGAPPATPELCIYVR